jgi:3-deoxy-D-manno-octulosonate 8-phosphate phosphatase (KDO 8-P phosphatase)
LSGKSWRDRVKRIRLLLLDVDGVLTDGRLAFDGAGQDLKFFHIRDGQGIRLML